MIKLRKNLSPPRSDLFISRQREIARIDRALFDPDINIITIHGAGGTGKTALASFAVDRQINSKRFPGGIVWIDCRSSDSMIKILTVIGHTLCEDPLPSDISELRDVVLYYLRSDPTLLVFDAYENVADNDAILSFIGRLPKQTKALILSRHRVRLPGREFALHLESLSKIAIENGEEQLNYAAFQHSFEQLQEEIAEKDVPPDIRRILLTTPISRLTYDVVSNSVPVDLVVETY